VKQATSDTLPLPLPWEAQATDARMRTRIGAPPPLPPGMPERPPVSGKSHGAKPPKRGPSKITHGLVALSSAAILAVYTVGYVRTESADAQLNGGGVSASRVIAAAPVVLSTGTIVPLPTTGSGNSGFFSPNTPTPAPTATLPAATPTANAVAAAVVATGTTGASPTAAATRSAATIAVATATPTNAPAPAPASGMTGANGAPTLVPFTPPRAIATAPAVLPPPTITTTIMPPTATHAATATTVAAAPAAAAAKTGKYTDGSYTGTGTSRRGDIEVAVTVQGGKITSAEITTCGTVYSCSRIAALPGQVITRQSATVDRVSGATYSTQAYQLAVADALAQAGGA